MRAPRLAPDRLRAVVLVLAVFGVASGVFGLLGLPSPLLFGALLGGLVHALTSTTSLAVPGWGARGAQGLLGVSIGVSVSPEAVAEVASDLGTIAAVTLGTIVLSLGAGRLLALRRDVSPVTGAFALIAGGASGITAIAHDLGADDRVVTVVQYLRVLMVLLLMPLVTTLVFHPATGQGTVGDTDRVGWPTGLAFTVVCLGLGLLVARFVKVSTAALLAPMLLAALLASSGWLGAVTVPAPLEWVAYAAIGLQVGLRFTRDSIARIARMLPTVVLLVLALIAATAAMGVVLAALTPVDPLTAYLATTPGGLFAVLVIAADSGSDVTYVMAVQLVRLLVILLMAPLLARWLRNRGERTG